MSKPKTKRQPATVATAEAKCHSDQRLVRLCLADVINLELACEHMTEAADVISHRGQKSLDWQRAFCKRLKAQLTQPNDRTKPLPPSATVADTDKL